MLPLEHNYHYFSALTHTKLKPYQPFSRANSRVSLPALDDTLCRFRFPISPNDSLRYGLWGHHRSSWACCSAGEPDSAADSGEEKTGDDDAGSNRRKGGWWSRWRRWRWQPLIQVQEIGILLLQIGIGFFVMRLLRPGIPLPGSDPKAPTVFVSVPYSEFLSRINSDEVQKVEVDGVHVMFKLKAGVGTSHDGGGDAVAENGGGSSSSITRLQESESLVKSVAPTKRIVYSTTRPSDIRTPYEKMLDNKVEFGSPDKRSGGFFNSALVSIWQHLCCVCDFRDIWSLRIKLELVLLLWCWRQTSILLQNLLSDICI